MNFGKEIRTRYRFCFARLAGVPLLISGESSTGKSRSVEGPVAMLKHQPENGYRVALSAHANEVSDLSYC